MLNFSKSITFLLLLLTSEWGYTQQQQWSCSTESTSLSPQQRIQLHGAAAKSDASAYFNARTLILPTMIVKPHIVRRSDGTGGLTEQDVSNVINDANVYFSEFGIKFIACSPNYIDNTTIYNEKSMYGNISTNNSWHPYTTADMIDVFFVEEASSSGWGALPSSSEDWIIITNVAALARLPEFIAHEFGHYFGLYHTHGTSCDNCTTDELANGFNCSTAGDLICDTPADPNLGNTLYPGIMNGCTYIGTYTDANGNLQNVLDANGDFYTPNVSNIMSYAGQSCQDHFSQEQKNLMLYTMTYHNKRNVFLSSCSCESDLTVLPNFDDLNMSFEASSTIVAHNQITGNSDIDYYAGSRIVLDRGFSVELGSKFDAKIQNCTAAKQQTIGDILRPYIIADSKHLITTVSELEEQKKILLSAHPNPFGKTTTIQFELPSSSQIELALYRLNGQRILQLQEGVLKAGLHEYQLDGKHLAAGIYLLSLQTEQDRTVQKLIVK